jgi:hypothetical protein
MSLTRRHFFYGTLLAGAIPTGGFGSAPSLKAANYKSPNEKLNIASIGAGGKAASDIAGCAATENIVALTDVDAASAAGTFNRYKVPHYKDYRQMLDKEGKGIDACIVTVPDHMHAIAAMSCMELGKHVYVQKPLVRTVWEARMMREAAEKYGVATQMGNQGYSNEGTRVCAEMIWAGEIGDVKEVHAWSDRPMWPQGLTKIPPPTPVPDTLDWDLWLGGAEFRPYTSGGPDYDKGSYGFYLPFNWRGFYDFGCGALGDMACHILGAPNMALRLSTVSPTSVECVKKEGVSDFMFPKSSTIRFDFPARGAMPPVTIFWYDGLKEMPKLPGVPAGELVGDIPSPPRRDQSGQPLPEPYNVQGRMFDYDEWMAFKKETDQSGKPMRMPTPDGSLFVGSKGMITTGTYGEQTRLLPIEKMKGYKYPPQFIQRSPGHYRDWIRACKGGEPSCSNFDVAGPFVEWMVLGVTALRVDGKLEWDGAKGRFTNNNEANKYLKPNYRKGWAPNWKG